MNKVPAAYRITMIIAALALSLPSVSLAIVGGTDDYSDFADPGSEWYGMDMSGIGRVRSGSAVAIGNRWFLTARHFALATGNTITMEDGSIFTITDTYNAPLTDGNLPDLKLVRVAEETDFWYDMYDPSLDPYNPQPNVIMAGSGYTGTTGVYRGNDFFEWQDTTTRDWRWGTNQLTEYTNYTFSSYTTTCFQMPFDIGATEYESGLGSGDSGGGVFAQSADGSWGLVGISTYIDAERAIYDLSYAVAVAYYTDWIDTLVPTGDLDTNDTLDAADIDLLFAAVDALGGTTPTGYELYDVNSDGVLDDTDKDFLIRTFMESQYGDANLDGAVDLLDLGILGDNYNAAGGWAQGDFNGDGIVTLLDLGILGDYYGSEIPSGVPEPATMALLAMGGLAILRRRRR